MSTVIPFTREASAHYGDSQNISPLVRRVLAENPSPFTYLGSGTYIIGSGEVAVIDPGPDDSTHIDAILQALAPGEQITHIFITHHHLDHAGGVDELHARTGAPSHGFGWTAPSSQVKVPLFHFGDPEVDGIDPRSTADESNESRFKSVHPDVTLAHGDIVQIGDMTLEAVYTPGHASDHLCYAFAQERLLFTGDHVMGWSTSVIPLPDGDLTAYMASLNLLLNRDEVWYLPTHGPAVTEPRSLVEALLAHRQERSLQILDVLREGPMNVIEIVPRIYGDVSKTLWRPAAASVWAHVVALAASGDVAPTEGELTSTSLVFRCK